MSRTSETGETRSSGFEVHGFRNFEPRTAIRPVFPTRRALLASRDSRFVNVAQAGE